MWHLLGAPSSTVHQHEPPDVLGISSCPSKYEIRGGKMVPQVSAASPAHARDSRASSIRESITQATRQRLQQEQLLPPRKSWLNRSSGWRPASSIYSTADEPARPHFSLSSWAMNRHSTRAPASPPSSPEPDHRHVDAAVSYQIEAYRASSTAQRNSGRVRASDSRRDHGPVKLSPAVPTKSSPVATGTVPTGGRPARVPPSYLGSRVQPNKGATTPKGSKAWPPVDDDLYVAPLNVRRGNQAPPASTRAALISASETSHDGAATTPTQRPRPRALNQADAPASIPSEPLATAPRSYPAVPARSPHRPRPRSPPPPPPLTSSADPSPSSISPALHSLALSARKPTPPVGAHSLRQDTSPFLGSSKPVAVRPAPEPAWVLPSSRFSATTCASSNPDTPRQSALPPLPARPHLSYSSWVTDSSADDRSVRATADADAASPGSLYSTTVHRAQSPVERKGDRTPRTLTMDTQSVDCRSSIMSMAKPLPLAPPELSASQDRIAQLTAYIESLIHRRLNICKSIQQMTELMPIDSLFASEDVLRKREAEKLKVQALRDELAEIKHAEYDAGLKLHRARKRLERDSDYEQTTLWVRRATGEDGA